MAQFVFTDDEADAFDHALGAMRTAIKELRRNGAALQATLEAKDVGMQLYDAEMVADIADVESKVGVLEAYWGTRSIVVTV